jgi:hypothetical protein
MTTGGRVSGRRRCAAPPRNVEAFAFAKSALWTPSAQTLYATRSYPSRGQVSASL